jgi:hypothetical protein
MPLPKLNNPVASKKIKKLCESFTSGFVSNLFLKNKQKHTSKICKNIAKIMSCLWHAADLEASGTISSRDF